MNLRNIESQLLELIDRYAEHFPIALVVELREFANVGECGLAFENLCEELLEFDVHPSSDEFRRLEAIGTYLTINRRYWEQLRRNR